MEHRTIIIDGKRLSAMEGETILQVAQQADIYIPTLCHLDGLANVAQCRLCLVEVVGSRKLLPACTTPVTEGMEIQTVTEELIEYRRMVVEFLLAEGNHVCSVCVANGDCEMQAMAVIVGVDHVRCEYMFPKRRVDISHKLFGIDHNRCVLCTRCVRVCDAIEGAQTWGIADRGLRARITADLDQRWGFAQTCTSCGKCVTACPTGAMFRKGATVAEMRRDRSRLADLVSARQRNKWVPDADSVL